MEFKTPEELGKHLRSRRKEMGFTQEQAAALANVGVRFIIDLEGGKATAALGKVLQVIRSYGFRIQLETKATGVRK